MIKSDIVMLDLPALDDAFPGYRGTWKPDDKDPGWVTSGPWSVQRIGNRWYVHIKQGHVEVCEFGDDLKDTRDATLSRAVEACLTYMRGFDSDIAAMYNRIEKLRIDQKATTETLGEFLGMKADFSVLPAADLPVVAAADPVSTPTEIELAVWAKVASCLPAGWVIDSGQPLARRTQADGDVLVLSACACIFGTQTTHVTLALSLEGPDGRTRGRFVQRICLDPEKIVCDITLSVLFQECDAFKSAVGRKS